MAQYRFSSQVIGRATGRSAVAAAAYRAGQSLTDERTGLAHDFSRKRGIAHTEIMAPDNAPDWMRDRAQLWNAVEKIETRTNSQLAREIQLSLPHELTDAQRLELVRGFVNSQFVARGMIADVALHHPDRQSDDRNHHAHIMLTMRELTAGGFHSSKATPTARSWNDKELLQTWREEWATQQNRILEREGHPARVDHRSLEAQGLDREPQSHLGPSAHGMEQRGEQSRIGDENRAKDSRNQERAGDHRQAAVVNLAIERHRRQHAATSAARIHAMEDAQRLDGIELDRRHHRQALLLSTKLESQYGAAERTMGAELKAVQSRAESTGWKRLLRKVTGAEKRDHQQAAQLSATLASIRQRKEEAMNALRVQQEHDRQAAQKRQAARVDHLKHELAKQGAIEERAILAAQEAARRAAVEDRARQAAEQEAGRMRSEVDRQQEQQADRPAPRKGLEEVRSRRERRPRPARRDRQEIEKQAQEKPAPQQEHEAVKRSFDNARLLPQEPRRTPSAPEYVARPAPAPSPSGDVPKPPQRTLQDVPAQKPAPASRQAEKLPVAKRDWSKTATPQQARQEPAPVRDWSKGAVEKNAPAAPARDWSKSAADRHQETRDRPAPTRNRDRDFDRER